MRRIKQLYTYSPVTGVEAYVTVDQRKDTIVRMNGLFGERLKLVELDVPSARYFTTAVGAIEAFIARAGIVLADVSRKEHHAGWCTALATARRDLSCQNGRRAASIKHEGR